MDFGLSEEQEGIRKLAAKILGDRVSPKSLKEAEAATGINRCFDRHLWSELARAGLLGVALPEEYGGGGLGLVELCLVLEQQGRTVAPIPLLSSLVMGALPIARFGSVAQKRAYLPGVASGEIVLGAALTEEGSSDPSRPATKATEATKDEQGWRLTGIKTCVAAAGVAQALLVPARVNDNTVGVFLVDPKGPGVRLEAQTSTTGEPLHRLVLEGAVVGAEDVLGELGQGRAIVDWMVERVVVGLCAMEMGVGARQLEMISDYVLKRQQFGKPIGLFQAVAQRAADAYIDVEAIRLSTWQAVWRLEAGLPATEAVCVAKFWASEGGARVAGAAQHLHGGTGFDKGYPLYRYYLLARQIELTLGGANQQLARLGEMLAAAGASIANPN